MSPPENQLPGVHAIFGRIAEDGFAWAEHAPESWPALWTQWNAAAGTAKIWWLTIVRHGGVTLAWRDTQIAVHPGSLVGGRAAPARCAWTPVLTTTPAGMVSLLLARETLPKLLAPLRGAALPPALARLVRGGFPELLVVPLPRTGFDLLAWVEELLAPPGPAFTHTLFFQAKALEALSLLAGAGGATAEPAPAAGPPRARIPAAQHRRERLARERVVRAQTLIAENLGEPLNLRELSRRVGCSPFYLSRTFSAHAGCTLQDYQRRARLHHAAELLRGGAHNVTEAAMAVGYNSLSHFTKAFRETFGCCPGLYPVTAARGGNPAR